MTKRKPRNASALDAIRASISIEQCIAMDNHIKWIHAMSRKRLRVLAQLFRIGLYNEQAPSVRVVTGTPKLVLNLNFQQDATFKLAFKIPRKRKKKITTSLHRHGMTFLEFCFECRLTHHWEVNRRIEALIDTMRDEVVQRCLAAEDRCCLDVMNKAKDFV